MTHDPRSAGYGDEVLLLREGRVVDRTRIADRVNGPARKERGHEDRGRAVLRWLEALDATPGPSAGGPLDGQA